MTRARFVALGLLLAGSFLLGACAQQVPAPILAAVGDPARPAEDVARDANRKPAESIAFSTMSPGQVVVDFLPGRGYFTRIFSKVVGPTGKVFALVPAENLARRAEAADPVKAIAANRAYANVTVINPAMAAFSLPEPADLVWTSLNYHDLHVAKVDMGPVNKAIFAALKPGGVYFVIDHVGPAGTGASRSAELHRIDPAFVKAEILAAGFLFDAESDILHNPDDDHLTRNVDGSIRGKTDQFVYRFRKPR
jgi:predicted methyltransferase